MNGTQNRFYMRQCSDERMLLQLIAFHDRFLSTAAHMTDGEVFDRYRYCPRAFTCLLSDNDAGVVLHGYFVLLPLNEHGSDAIRRGSVSCGREIAMEHLAQSDADIAAVYLSVVCASQARARAATIDAIVNALRGYYHQQQVRSLFVRAATTDGSRILQRLLRMPFRPDGLIHEVDLTSYDVITS